MNRRLDLLAEQDFDLLILGGGITGAGVALDAATRGLRVALIDKGDFASGTSSVSSKLVHGGLRYLEYGDLRLVYEAQHERHRLLRNAPHQVWPLRFVMPFYQGSRLPPWKGRAGLLLYDLLAGAGNIRRSRALSALALRRELPGLRGSGLVGGAEFSDAQMDDARLCVEVVRTAALHGALATNYVEAVGFEKTAGRITGVQAVDRLGGAAIAIRARQVLNATDPWGDAVRRLAGEESGPLLHPTKGVHLVAPGRDLPAAFLLLHPADGRVFFVIPWLGKTLIGTTDTECDDSPDQLKITPADIDYLLEGHNHYFAPGLKADELLSQFVGLRPLLRSRPGDPSALSREFHLSASPSGLLSVAGGKYTTYRHMAEVITDAVARRLGVRRRCRTRALPLDGTPRGDWPTFVAAEVRRLGVVYGLDEDAARHLVGRYGRRAEDVVGLGQDQPELWQPIVVGEPDLRAELVYQRRREMAQEPADFLLRRTRLGLFHPQVLERVLEEALSRYASSAAGR
jgi:glycerol-3-phosphate dehydrogenase